MTKSPEELAHQEWLGYVQPVGLVVSIPAMLEAQCYVNKNIMAEHAHFLSCLPQGKGDEPVPEISDFQKFTQKVLGWEPEDLVELSVDSCQSSVRERFTIAIPQYNEILRPTHVAFEFQPASNQQPAPSPSPLLLLQDLPSGTNFDEPGECDSAKHWNAAPQAKFERLLRETGVPIGLLSNRRQLRLVYAPKGESSGYATFNVNEMMQVAGRPMFGALHMLLCADRMFTLGDNQRLPAILLNSRKYQNTVSTKLAEQVLAALYELMRGFQAANDVRNGDLLRDVLATDPNHVYAGLLRVLMRLVFVLYAEDRDLLSNDPIYTNYYSVTGLFNRLREDAGRHTDTMNQRYGAWSQLLTLFRLIYEGGQHGEFKLPARKGYLFDPERYPFLEGRVGKGVARGELLETSSEKPATSLQHLATLTPRVSDGVIYKVLRNLLILDGERLSYRTLDVEQIGSVYETVMGFNLEVAKGRSIAIKPVKAHGAPATINLTELLKTPGKDRAKWLKEHSDQTLGKEAGKQLKEAESMEQLLEALDKKIAKKVTPRTVPKGAIVLQPSDERRRSGSHYTPRSLTEPIVRTTLEPILKQLLVVSPELLDEEQKLIERIQKLKTNNQQLTATLHHVQRRRKHAQAAAEKQTPHPAQILDLKICDPAMGSGAFLVEACRQLADELVKSWYAHFKNPSSSDNQQLTTDNFPSIPPDEDEVLYARRQIAQRCLYGVDKNEMAVDLAKLSLWLVTLAKDHPFTFLDHSLRHGDSLVGLTRKQIIGFHWEPKKQKQFGEELIQLRLDKATEARAKILNAREDVPYRDQEQRLALADEALNVVRMTGDACVSAFFAGSKKKEREDRCEKVFACVGDWYASGHDIDKRVPIAKVIAELRSGQFGVVPFHWEIEFPEVFSRQAGGFDSFVGNPPFLGGFRVWPSFGTSYRDWLLELHSDTTAKADFVAHFFRRAFHLLGRFGSFGFVATNAISQGDTRRSSLTYICMNGGSIFNATTRFAWPGQASVVVSIVHVAKRIQIHPVLLDRKRRDSISAFLIPGSVHTDPASLRANDKKSFRGCMTYGVGFLFDDNDPSASSTDDMRRLIAKDPRNQERIFHYIGGHELNSSPTFLVERFAIDFADMTLDEARRWPDLIEVVEEKVRPERERLGGYSVADTRKRNWWLYGTYTPSLNAAIKGMDRILVIARISSSYAFAFLPARVVCNEKIVVFPFDTYSAFATMQSRVHESWVRLLSSSLKDDLQYTATSCFSTFPFCPHWTETDSLEDVGKKYYLARAIEMQLRNCGLTDFYNRFHNPHEKSSEIAHLRELHDAMDREVLVAYGWDDLAKKASCEFLLDYDEEDGLEAGSQSPASSKKSKKKKPWRLRWPDDFRDEVLARLLELNEQRHKEELLVASSQLLEKKKTLKKTGAKSESAVKKKRATKKSVDRDLFTPILEREHRFLLMLLRAWDGKAVARRVLNASMILMLDDNLRVAMLTNGKISAGKRKNETELNQIFTELSIDGFIEKSGSTHQQAWRIAAMAPSTDDAAPEDINRVKEVMLFLKRQMTAEKLTVSEEVVDAEVDLIPA